MTEDQYHFSKNKIYTIVQCPIEPSIVYRITTNVPGVVLRLTKKEILEYFVLATSTSRVLYG